MQLITAWEQRSRKSRRRPCQNRLTGAIIQFASADPAAIVVIMSWQLHWLEATSDLGPWRDRIAAEVAATREHLAAFLPPPRLDILVQRLPTVIPEIGMVGHAYRAGLFGLTVDPDNSNFEAALSDGTLQRQVAHEVHHCLRMAGPGYGRTLGEALASEGLAGRFTQWLYGNGPEPWECAVDAATLQSHAPDAAELAAADYGHYAWFFGVGGTRPRWLGYTMGYSLVGAWLDKTGMPDADTWVNVPAATVLTAGGAIAGAPL